MTTESTKQALPLREAAIRWCDPSLAGAYQVASADLQLLRDMKARKRRPPPGHRYAAMSTMLLTWEMEDAEPRSEAAEADLIVDLRVRVARGEFVLSGWSTAPGAELRPTMIPSALADEIHFQLLFDAVVVRRTRYSRVTAMRTTPTRGAPPDKAASPVRARGRKSATPLIEAALRQHWGELFPAGPPQGPPVWTELARKLEKRMRSELLGDWRQPQEETIRTRLPDIYARVLSEKARLDKSAQ